MSCSQGKQTKIYNQGINIIPAPQQMVQKEGSFSLKDNLVISSSSKEGRSVAEFFASKINKSTGFNIEVGKEKGKIILQLQPEMKINNEGYELNVTSKLVTVKAKTAAGLFYGMQTFLQLLPAEIENSSIIKSISWTAPCVEIKDSPRFGYRGTMLDVCRHFFTIKELEEQIDVLSLFKINYLHLHLTDDQGWRIEIKKYPKLTQIGSVRTLGNGEKYGGYYTQKELKDLVAYAAKRFVTIVPEFELPGHELAAISAYPNLACDSEIKLLKKNNISIQPRNTWGVEKIVMCPGKEDMFDFIEEVIKEMVEIFPGTYFHVGGDECPKDSWKSCPMCQKRIKDEGLKGDNNHPAEEKLQGYVLQRVEKELTKYGKKLIGWDEILDGGLSQGASVMSWRGEKGGIMAAMQNHDVIMTPSNVLYLDYYQGDSKIEPVAIGGYGLLKKVYMYNPVPDTLTVLNKGSYIKGVQCNLWSEYIPDKKMQDYRLYPRILALAEVAWTNPDKKDFKDFCRRLNNGYVRLDGHNVNYHIPLPEQPNGSCNYVAFTDSVKVSFKTTRPIKMVYTLDGTEPTLQSKEYTKPLEFKKDGIIKIRSVLVSGKMSRVRVINVKKEKFAPSTELKNKKHGLQMKYYSGHFRSAKDLEGKKADNIKVIRDIKEMLSYTKDKRNVIDIKYYGTVAEGYVNIPKDGVYYFSSNDEEVWIDGKLLIDNGGDVKRFSRNDKSIALAKGLHRLKVVFLVNITGGVPSFLDGGKINIRESGKRGFKALTSEDLFM